MYGFEKSLLKDYLYFIIFANIDKVNKENWENELFYIIFSNIL